MKKLLLAAALCLLVLFFPPLLSVLFAGTNGMAICFILFFAVNPVFFALLGLFAARSVKTRWYLPVLAAAVYVLSMWVLFTPTETAWLLYAVIYLFIAIAVGLVAALVKKTKPKEIDA